MGIKNFHSFLRKKVPHIYKQVHLSELRHEKLSIDTSIYMCKYKNSYGNKWLEGFYNLILFLRNYDINFIFVLDSKAPPEKELERESRILLREKNRARIDLILDEWEKYNKENPKQLEYNEDDFKKCDNIFNFLTKKKINYPLEKENLIKILHKLQKNLISIASGDFDLLKEMFDLMSVSYYLADSEAEGTCSLMNRKGLVDGVLTEDTDVMAYGTPVMFYGLNMKDHTVCVLRLSDVLKSLNISFNQLQDFCIMCGTDYNTNIDRVGPSKSFDLIHTNGSLEKLTEKMNTNVLNYERVRELFDCDKYELQITEFNTTEKLTLDTTSLRKFCFYNNITFQKLTNL